MCEVVDLWGGLQLRPSKPSAGPHCPQVFWRPAASGHCHAVSGLSPTLLHTQLFLLDAAVPARSSHKLGRVKGDRQFVTNSQVMPNTSLAVGRAFDGF